jgi:hypothetical protein
MSEVLRECPFCGSKAEVISFPVFDTTGGRTYSPETADKKYYVQCKSCATQCGALEYDTPDKATAAWNRRAQPDNPPLTLEQLKQMDNQPVWTDKRCGVVRAEPQITRRPGMPAIYFNYGWEWADDVFTCGPVYAHKPEKDGEEE